MRVEINIDGPVACGKTHLARMLLPAISAIAEDVSDCTLVCQSRNRIDAPRGVEFEAVIVGGKMTMLSNAAGG